MSWSSRFSSVTDPEEIGAAVAEGDKERDELHPIFIVVGLTARYYRESKHNR